jgi:hypothetical protein
MQLVKSVIVILLAIVSTANAEVSTAPYFQAEPTFPFDLTAFARDMGVRSVAADSLPPFWRTTKDDITKKNSLELSTAQYSCRNNLNVTLIPMIHIGEKSYYDQADQVANSADYLLFEGLRLPYFFGPPFETDPRIKSNQDLNILNSARLLTIKKMIVSFHRVMNRNPKTLFEISSGIPGQVPPGYLEHTAFDPWGHLFEYKAFVDGSVKVANNGSDVGSTVFTIEIPADLPSDAQGLPSVDGIEAYIKLGQAANLTLQTSYHMTSYARPTSKNADVSLDMVLGVIPQLSKATNNDYRNLVAIVELDKIAKKSQKPLTVAIMYGALHMSKFHQFITGDRFGCVVKQVSWIKAIESTPNEVTMNPQQSDLREMLINSFKNISPTLDPDPLGIHKK